MGTWLKKKGYLVQRSGSSSAWPWNLFGSDEDLVSGMAIVGNVSRIGKSHDM